MPRASPNDEPNNARIVLGLLESVERDSSQSQRKLASDLGIALGLVNAYLKRCVKKGLLKVGQVPPRRYAYYLTPHGFAEKSRLTVEYLSSSLSFFRSAREDCSCVLKIARARNWNRAVLFGVSDLAEIAMICALEQGITVVAMVDAKATRNRFLGAPVVESLSAVREKFDALVVTDPRADRGLLQSIVGNLGSDRVLVPALLGIQFESASESEE